MTSAQNKKAITDGVRSSFEAAGIPRRFWKQDMTLTTYSGGDIVIDWITEVGDGGYANFIAVGDNLVALDIMYLACRGLLLSGEYARVYGLREFYRHLTDTERDSAMPNIIFLHNFQQDRECPLRPYEVEDVEEFMVRHLNNGGMVAVRHVPMKKRPREWWSNTLIELINRESRTVICR